MGGATGNALEWALALLRAPGERHALRLSPLPQGIDRLLAIAAGAEPEEVVADTARALGESGARLREAAQFYAREVLFHPQADAYRTLGVSPDTNPEQIKIHHRLLQLWLHPDRQRNEDDSLFAARVNIAWNRLRNDERRRAYDRDRAEEQALESEGEVGAMRYMAPTWTPVLPPERLSSSWNQRLPVLGLVGVCLLLGWLVVRNAEREPDAWVLNDGVRLAEDPATNATEAPAASPLPQSTAVQTGSPPPVRKPQPSPVHPAPIVQPAKAVASTAVPRAANPLPPVRKPQPSLVHPAPIVQPAKAVASTAVPKAANPLPPVRKPQPSPVHPAPIVQSAKAVASVTRPITTKPAPVAAKAQEKPARVAAVAQPSPSRSGPKAAVKSTLPLATASTIAESRKPARVASAAKAETPLPARTKPVRSQPGETAVAKSSETSQSTSTRAVQAPTVSAPMPARAEPAPNVARVEQARRVGAQLLKYMVEVKRGPPPIWNNPAIMSSADGLRHDLHSHGRARVGVAQWRIGNESAALVSSYQVDGIEGAEGRGTLTAEMIWREDRWLIVGLSVERAR